MIKTAFVVLHYIVDKDTIECVESIRKYIDTAEYKIIIVDNCSPNDSYERLKDKYQNSQDIILIHNEENLGFAKGNNVGFRYAKQQLDAEFIIMMNNDVLMIEDGFFQKISEEYKKSRFAVLGPMILTKDGRYNSNPLRENALTLDDVNYMMNDIKKKLFWGKRRLERFYVKFCKPKDVTLPHKPHDYIHRQEDVCLHGCFWVFSRIFSESFDGLDEGTFLYVEEDILYTQLTNKKMKTVYVPDIHIYHKEDASANAAASSKKDKRMRFYHNLYNSLGRLKEILEEREE